MVDDFLKGLLFEVGLGAAGTKLLELTEQLSHFVSFFTGGMLCHGFCFVLNNLLQKHRT
jgi:hypothetical protein